MKILKGISAFIDFLKKLVELFLSVFKNINFSGTYRKTKYKFIASIIIIVVILISVGCGAVYIFGKDERVSEETEETYPPVIQKDEEKGSDIGVKTQELPTEKSEFDIKKYNAKYYDDSLFTYVTDLPSDGKAMDKFITQACDIVSGKNVRNSASIADAAKEVHDFLSRASSMDNEDDITVTKERAQLRANAFALCYNSSIARLVGHDFYKVFLSAHGTEEKLKYSNLSIQYFNRSIMCSGNDNKNKSYCALLLGYVYSHLVMDETDIANKVMLNLRAALCMEIAKSKYPAEGLAIASYFEVCYLAAQRYLIMLQLCEKGSPMLEYYYNKARTLYDESLSDRNIIKPADENRYLSDSSYLETIYKEKLTLN